MSINYRARRRNLLRKQKKVTNRKIKGKTLLVIKSSYRTCTTGGTSLKYFILDANGSLKKVPASQLSNYDEYNKTIIPAGGFLQLQRGNSSYYYHITSGTPKKMTRSDWLEKQDSIKSRSRSRKRSRRKTRSRKRSRSRK